MADPGQTVGVEVCLHCLQRLRGTPCPSPGSGCTKLIRSEDTKPVPQPVKPIPPIQEINAQSLSNTAINRKVAEKRALLEQVRLNGVVRIVQLHCKQDPQWSLDLLTAARPSLQQLSVHRPPWKHLLALYGMPQLRRLDIRGGSVIGGGPQLPPLPAASSHGLHWLRVYDLPRDTTASLLRAHGHSLQTLRLRVGSPVQDGGESSYHHNGGGYGYSAETESDEYDEQEDWQDDNDDLDTMLSECNLHALQWLLVNRDDTTHCREGCESQLEDVRAELTQANVICSNCNALITEKF